MSKSKQVTMPSEVDDHVGLFDRFAGVFANASGKAAAFSGAVLVICGWALTGPLMGFSDTWQLLINTGTTLVTFLMVFVIQNTQNRDNQATQHKLNAMAKALLDLMDAIAQSEALPDVVREDLAADLKELHRAVGLEQYESTS